jgi:hypothetical protein
MNLRTVDGLLFVLVSKTFYDVGRRAHKEFWTHVGLFVFSSHVIVVCYIGHKH